MTKEQPTEIIDFRATLNGALHRVPYEKGKTLLECLLIQGLEPLHSCRKGRCGSCMVKKKTGVIQVGKNKALSPRDLEAGYVLLCRSLPMSNDVWVDCDE